MCTCSFVNESDFPRIVKTFDEAFADYHLKLKTSCEPWLYKRCVKNGVAFDCSVGAFDGDRMVGITLIGLDDWQGVSAAFDVATGVVPDYRGGGLARRMFDLAVPRLKERGVRKFILEVLQVNEPAIKTYQKSGFEITREFDCYELPLKEFEGRSAVSTPWVVRPITRDKVNSFREHVDWQPSWENNFSSILRTPDEVVALGAYDGSHCVGELVYYPLLNWIPSLVVRREYRRKGIGGLLLTHFLKQLDSTIGSVKLVNVDHSDDVMTAFLHRCGFRLYTSQYEMELAL